MAQWHVDEDAASSPFGLNRWLDWGIYHAGGLDSLLGATQWVQSPAEQDDYAATELFFVRDHLGSPALAMQAKRTLVSGETYRWELQPVESYEYAPYGDPTIHIPATNGSPQSAGRLALKDFESFAMTGAKSSESLLDRNDVGRPSGSSGNTWTRSGAVPVAKSFLGWSHLFTGRPWDADVRQYYIRHRWYEPLTERWTAVDPIGYAGGLNQYLYCSANPVSAVDPLGLDDWWNGPMNVGGLLDKVWTPTPGDPLPPSEKFKRQFGEVPPHRRACPNDVCANLACALNPIGEGDIPPDIPRPPGYNPDSWESFHNDNPNVPPGREYEFVDPEGNRYCPHLEDEKHNPHWDVKPSGGRGWINVPSPGQSQDDIFKPRRLIIYYGQPGDYKPALLIPLLLAPLLIPTGSGGGVLMFAPAVV